jgi:hypothetical protein
MRANCSGTAVRKVEQALGGKPLPPPGTHIRQGLAENT